MAGILICNASNVTITSLMLFNDRPEKEIRVTVKMGGYKFTSPFKPIGAGDIWTWDWFIDLPPNTTDNIVKVKLTAMGNITDSTIGKVRFEINDSISDDDVADNLNLTLTKEGDETATMEVAYLPGTRLVEIPVDSNETGVINMLSPHQSSHARQCWDFALQSCPT